MQTPLASTAQPYLFASATDPLRSTNLLSANIRHASLIPLNTPTQSSLNVRKRGRSEVDGYTEDEDGEIPPDTSTMDVIMAKRKQNALAARRSRIRKLEYTHKLEESLAAITRDRDMWRERAYRAENKLRAHGLL